MAGKRRKSRSPNKTKTSKKTKTEKTKLSQKGAFGALTTVAIAEAGALLVPDSALAY